MATKTFEELKQMAIQIRDEKANKQNTATRIGTQMLEHLNKLEQEYYDKTNIDDKIEHIQIESKNKGYYQTKEQLLKKYPNPSDGDTAWVGTPYPGNVYDVVDGQWHDTGVSAGSGGSGTTDYNVLQNKPKINNTELTGNKTSLQSRITSVNVDVDNNIGVPSGSATISGNTLNLNLKNLKGATGEKGGDGEIGPVGPIGPQGNSGITGSPDDMVVVNDLNGGESTTGSIKVLAAEQGKVLAQMIAEQAKFLISYIITGKGDDYEYNKATVIKGRIYKLSLKRKWSCPVITDSKEYFSVYYLDTNSAYKYLCKITYATKDELKLSYTFRIPSDIKDDSALFIGGRATAGDYITYTLQDVTDIVSLSTDLMLLEQGGFNAATGDYTEDKYDLRVRCKNYINPNTYIETKSNVVVWLVVYFNKDSFTFVKALNPKTSAYTTEDGYIARVVFAKTNGTDSINPEEVFGVTTGSLLANNTANSNGYVQDTINVQLEHGIYYNAPSSGSSGGFADYMPSSLIGRETFLLASKTPNYMTCGTSISVETDSNLICHFFGIDGTHKESFYSKSLTNIEALGDLVKFTLIPGSITSHNLEIGSFDSVGNEVSSTNRKRTVSYISLDDFDFILRIKGQNVNYRIYDSTQTGITENGALPLNFLSDGGLIPKSIILRYYPDAKYIRGFVADANDSTAMNSLEFVTIKSSDKVGEFSYSTDRSIEIVKDFGKYDETINCYYDTEVNRPTEGVEYYSKILLRLPKNYNNKSNVPLVLFKTGSDTFKNMSVSEFNYVAYIKYLVDCGFAVFDYFANTSKYPTTDGFGTPTNIMAAHSAFNYLCKHYNFDESKFFVACKSLGGDIASILSFSGLPIRAVGMLAPALNPARWCFGYTQEDQHVYADDFGFKGDWQTVLNGSRDYNRSEFKELVRQNLDKLSGHLPMQLGVTNKMFEELIVEQGTYNPDASGTFDEVIKVLKVPTKIWAAPDDANTSINMHRNYIKSAQNGCSKAVMRELPSGTGGHHAVDNDPSAPQTTDITTRLGIHYDTMTTAWVELAEWFIGYGG